MYSDISFFLSGLLVGILLTLSVVWLVSHVYSRMSGQAGPTLVGSQMAPPLPFAVKDERAEARIERETIQQFLDNPDALGR